MGVLTGEQLLSGKGAFAGRNSNVCGNFKGEAAMAGKERRI